MAFIKKIKNKKLSDFFESEGNFKFKNSAASNSGKNHHQSFDFLNLIKDWNLLVGPTLGKNTIPLKIQNKALIILTGHSAFSEQLSFMEHLIRNKIIAKFPNLKNSFTKISFKADNNFFTSQKELMNKIEKKSTITIHKQSPIYKKLERESLELFNDLDDNDMKDLLRSIYIQSFYTEK